MPGGKMRRQQRMRCQQCTSFKCRHYNGSTLISISQKRMGMRASGFCPYTSLPAPSTQAAAQDLLTRLPPSSSSP